MRGVGRRWGVTLPINQDCRLGDMINAEQAAGLCEALTGLDASDVRLGREGEKPDMGVGSGELGVGLEPQAGQGGIRHEREREKGRKRWRERNWNSY